jgi:MoaA/NifB/PqqE/SkfB family radical SAM enzyme
MKIEALYDKYIKTESYEIYFNTQSGFELIQGINGCPDPSSLELPSLLDVGIMGHCINKCHFCYQGHERQEHMKLDDFKSIVDQVCHHTNQIALGGRGDPNHHPNFKEILEYCNEKNVVPNYTTSGINLTDEQVELSKMCGAVAVSDYQNKHTYDAIRKFQQAGIKTNIHFLFTSKTARTAFKFLNGQNPWDSNVDLPNLNAVVFLLFKPQGQARYDTKLIPTKAQLDMFSILVEHNWSPTKFGMDSCMANHIEIPKGYEPFITTCEAARQSAYISPNMRMVPCSFVDEGYKRVSQKPPLSIEETWNNDPLFKQFRSLLLGKANRCPCGFNV